MGKRIYAGAALCCALAISASALAGAAPASASAVETKEISDNILISAFWVPTYEYMGDDDAKWDEQYRLLSEGGIDWLAHVTDNVHGKNNKLTLPEYNLKMGEYAAKYGMKITVADYRFGQNLLSLGDEAIEALVGEYRGKPGIGGYYIWDEPPVTADFSQYNRVYAAIKRADPDAYAHLNFLPAWAYPGGYGGGGFDACQAAMEEWLSLNASTGYKQDYLMYDFYPFNGSTMLRNEYYDNLDMVRQTGAKYGVKTACYIQSNGGNGKPCPTPDQIRFQAMSALAYGYKQLSYFTWFQPTNRGSETFYDSIVDQYGKPNPVTYEPVKRLNAEVHALGKVLGGLECEQVFLNGRQWGKQKAIPDDFFLQPADDELYTVSLMKDKSTRRNYVMFVNNDYDAETSLRAYLPIDVDHVEEVSKTDGSLKRIDLSGATLEVTLAAGDGALFALPEGMSFTPFDPSDVDKSGAEAALAEVDAAASKLVGKDTAALDALVQQLRMALSAEATQDYIDGLTRQVREALAALLQTEKDPEGGGDNSNKESGCGAVAAGCGGLLLLAALPALLPRRRKD